MAAVGAVVGLAVANRRRISSRPLAALILASLRFAARGLAFGLLLSGGICLGMAYFAPEIDREVYLGITWALSIITTTLGAIIGGIEHLEPPRR